MRDHLEVESILKTLGQLEILTKFLQSEDRLMYEVREAFDKAKELFTCLEDYCSADSVIVCDPVFESAICKIQQNQILGDPLKLTPKET
jgi:hypothetical protein